MVQHPEKLSYHRGLFVNYNWESEIEDPEPLSRQPDQHALICAVLEVIPVATGTHMRTKKLFVSSAHCRVCLQVRLCLYLCGRQTEGELY